MFKKFIILMILVLTSCATTQSDDLSDTQLYMYPARIYLDNAAVNYTFTSKAKRKAILEAKKQRLDVLFEVFLDKNGSVASVKRVYKTKYADTHAETTLKKSLKTSTEFPASSYRQAFYYGYKVRVEFED